MMDYTEFTKEYQAQLKDLTFNSKPLINTLTMLASENIPAATSIQGVIENQILRVRGYYGFEPAFPLAGALIELANLFPFLGLAAFPPRCAG
jgi:hypothetical protein